MENDIEEICITLEIYLQSNNINYNGIQLVDDHKNWPSLNDIRETYLDSLMEEFESYFPDGNLENFEVLSPARMPKANDEVIVRVYGIAEITGLARFFKIDEENCINEWQTLLLSIVKSPNYCTIEKEETDPILFWAQLLAWPEITWQDTIKELIETVLAIPISSAEAERGFSIMNYIRNSRRKSLSGENLQHIMRY